MPNYFQRLLDVIPSAERGALVKSWAKHHRDDPEIEEAIQQLCARLDIEYVAYQPNGGREAAARGIYMYAKIGAKLMMEQKKFTSLYRRKRGRPRKPWLET